MFANVLTGKMNMLASYLVGINCLLKFFTSVSCILYGAVRYFNSIRKWICVSFITNHLKIPQMPNNV